MILLIRHNYLFLKMINQTFKIEILLPDVILYKAFYGILHSWEKFVYEVKNTKFVVFYL